MVVLCNGLPWGETGYSHILISAARRNEAEPDTVAMKNKNSQSQTLNKFNLISIIIILFFVPLIFAPFARASD